MMPQEVAAVPPSAGDQMLAMAREIATNPQADVSKLREVLAIAKEMRQDEAQTFFNIAMGEAQADMTKAVSTNKLNTQTTSKYVTYDKLDAVLRPIYVKHGFAVSFDTGTAPEGSVDVMAYVSHKSGFTRTYHVLMPADGKGAKGNDVMTRTHATGAAMTYGRRYLLCLAFNVAIDTDTDGNMPDDKIKPEQADALKKLIDDLAFEVAGPEADYVGWMEAFLAKMGVQAIGDLPAKNFGRAKDSIAVTRRERVKK